MHSQLLQKYFSPAKIYILLMTKLHSENRINRIKKHIIGFLCKRGYLPLYYWIQILRKSQTILRILKFGKEYDEPNTRMRGKNTANNFSDLKFINYNYQNTYISLRLSVLSVMDKGNGFCAMREIKVLIRSNIVLFFNRHFKTHVRILPIRPFPLIIPDL